MSMIFFLAPNGRWSARTLVGDAAVDGTVETFVAGTVDEPKVTWSDPEGQNENPTTVQLDAAGEANIYWGFDPDAPQLYYIRVRDKDGNLVYDQDNYPTTFGTGGNFNPNRSLFNYVRNPQFTFWSNSTNYPAISASQTIYDYVTDEWTFARNNTTAICNVSRQAFALGQSVVPGNPIYYLHYECGDATGASETYKRFRQIYQSVQTLSGEEISFGFWAKSAAGSTVSVTLSQFYGTGGTPSATVVTPVVTATLTNAWRQYKATITMPAAGGTLGTDPNSDYLALDINVPLNSFSSSLDMDCIQLCAGDSLPPFVVNSQEANYMGMQNLISQSLFKTGSYRQTLNNDPDAGWLLCDDTTIGNFSSNATHAFLSTQALYSVIWNKISNVFAPVFNSDGTVSTRGASAAADYNANKQIALTKTLGRILATAGEATLSQPFTAFNSQTFTANDATDALAMSDASSFFTGTPIRFTTTNTLPAPLAPATFYYAISVDATHIKVASSLANALAGTFLDITTTGTGVQTIQNAGQIAVLDNTSFYTGTPVVLTTTGVLPAPLAVSTTYYAINAWQNLTDTYIELASSFQNAIAGIAIGLTSAGTGTQTISINYENWQPGQLAGEFKHAQTEPEVGKHRHQYSALFEPINGTVDSGPDTPTTNNTFFTTYAGESQPFNIMQPVTFIYTQLKL